MNRPAVFSILCRGFRLVLLALAAISASSADATVINFAPLSQPGAGFNNVGSVYVQDGFQFTSTNVLGAWQDSSPNHPVGGVPTTSLTEFFAGATTTMTKVGGAPFDLNGVQLAGYSTAGSGPFAVTFVGTKADSSIVQHTFFPFNANGSSPVLQPFGLYSFNDVVSVTFTQGFNAINAFQLNDLSVDLPGPQVGDPVILMDSVSGFSGVQGRNGIEYGYFTVPGNPVTFTTAAMGFTNDSFGGLWEGPYVWPYTPGLTYPNLNAVGGHPISISNPIQAGPADASAVRRYTVEGLTAPTYANIAGVYQDSGGGQTQTVRLYVDGALIFQDNLALHGAQLMTYSHNVWLTPTSVVEWEIAANPTGFQYASTTFTGTIAYLFVPEPSTTVFALLAAVAMSFGRHFREQ